MSLNQTEGAETSIMEPWPLATSAILRVLAWPRYDDIESIKRVLTVAEPLFDNQKGCLCLRHDRECDIPYEQAVMQLQRAFDAMSLTGDLEVLFITEEMLDTDWPRLAKSITAVIQVDTILDDTRKSFLAALSSGGVEIIGIEDPLS
jgi:hypothetical protein